MATAGAEALPPFSEGLCLDLVQKQWVAGRENKIGFLGIGVMESCGMGGIPPARLAHHAPLALMFSNTTRSGDCVHSLGIAFPLSTWVGFIAITTPMS
jgi:hypothetical protein